MPQGKEKIRINRKDSIMNNKQLQNATEEMISWLSHPQELGKAPAKIECAKEFDYGGLHYYIFKYKKTALGKWLLGVCGGYEENELVHCGHVYSEMEEYNEATAEEDAVKIVEYVISYWKEQAKEAEEKKNSPGTFVSFVLLEEAAFDKESLLETLKSEWQIEDQDAEKETDEGDDMAILSYNGGIAAISLMPGPIPEDEIVYHAGSNFLWKDAVETSKRHKAHLIVSFMGRDIPVLEAGEIMVKLVASACKQKGVLGVYANGTVYQPEMYLDCAQMAKDGEFPMYNLVWFGLYNGKNGVCGYTDGMRSLGYDEMEIIDSKQTADEIINLLFSIAGYVTSEDVILNPGETIGFTEEQKLLITKSRGIALEGDTLKIEF